ncbi:hypothetical protein J5834_02710 [bacterium]|nr:hypothetical protein [bacterium]
MFAKIIGLTALVFVLAQAAGVGEEQLKYVTDIVKITLTQHEVNSIAHMIYTGKILFAENEGRLPDYSEEEWAHWIRREMSSKAGGRDTSKDYWETPYSVEETDEVPGLSGPGFLVRSNGPDTKRRSEDDILAGYEYRN